MEHTYGALLWKEHVELFLQYFARSNIFVIILNFHWGYKLCTPHVGYSLTHLIAYMVEPLGTRWYVKGLVGTLALRRDVSSLCVLFRIYHVECSEELFDLLSVTEFSNSTVRHKLKYHPHCMDMRHSTTV